MNFEIIVHLKQEVLDAQGRAIKTSLQRLGYEDLLDVKAGKRFVISVNDDGAQAQARANEIAAKFLANPVSETYIVRRLEGDAQT